MGHRDPLRSCVVSRLVKVLITLVVIAAVGVAGFFVFEYFDHHEKVKDAERACGSLTSPTPGVALPTGLGSFAVPSDQTLLEVDSQGKTLVVYTITKGSRKDLVSLRDKVVAQLAAQGLTASATDQEPTYEAEGQFSGTVSGTIQVQPQCQGYDRIRYKFSL
ncbi:MAG: hypothetical protein QOG99_1598 [Frankiales bacterium]|jgi:hypothetical protein|nr:hypothetical protein [Frankiales bacterium]